MVLPRPFRRVQEKSQLRSVGTTHTFGAAYSDAVMPLQHRVTYSSGDGILAELRFLGGPADPAPTRRIARNRVGDDDPQTIYCALEHDGFLAVLVDDADRAPRRSEDRLDLAEAIVRTSRIVLFGDLRAAHAQDEPVTDDAIERVGRGNGLAVADVRREIHGECIRSLPARLAAPRVKNGAKLVRTAGHRGPERHR